MKKRVKITRGKQEKKKKSTKMRTFTLLPAKQVRKKIYRFLSEIYSSYTPADPK